MVVIKQKQLSVENVYDEVNKKLNVLINKINMARKEKNVANAMIRDASEKALRTFITGLRDKVCNTLYASNPPRQSRNKCT